MFLQTLVATQVESCIW